MWLVNKFLDMTHLHQKKNIKAFKVSVFKESVDLDGVGILDYIFQILNTEYGPVKKVMPCLVILSQKSENDIAKHHRKNITLWEKLKIIWKKYKWSWEITFRFLRRREERKAAENVGVFCWNLGITAYTLKNYSNFKSKFSFKNGNIF